MATDEDITTMRILFQRLVGNGTTVTVNCPPMLLKPVTNNDGVVGCEYNNLAYALFALVTLIIVGIPFVAVICYVHRRIRHKQRARPRGLSHSASLDSSSAYPYQPLHREGATSYGATDNSSVEEQAIRSPSHDSTASLGDRLSQHPDTTSVASSRASMIPTYDEVSLNHRNAFANKSHHPKNERRPSRLSTDSQEKGVDQPGPLYDSVDVVSNVPKLQKQTVPKDQKQPPPKPPRQFVNEANTAVTEEPVYSVLEGPETDGAFQPPTNDAPSVILEGAKPSAAGADGNSGADDESSPEYAVLEPFPEEPNNDEDQAQYNEDEHLPSEQTHSLLHDEKPADNTDGAAVSSPPDTKYLTVLPATPPKQMTEPTSGNAALLESSGPHNLDEYSVSPKDDPSKSRTDFEEFLLEKVRALPANERNGTFLIRDSISSTGSKVLTMYCWNADSNKELYNFRIRSTEDGQTFLHRSSNKFSDLNGLLEDLREHKDMLPCVLTTPVFP